MEDEKLIESVRNCAALYDTSHPKYLDYNFKCCEWKTISKEMKQSVDACKKRWVNIRDQFKKCLNRRKHDQNVRKYKYENELQFLLPYVNERDANESVMSVASYSETDGELKSSLINRSTDGARLKSQKNRKITLKRKIGQAPKSASNTLMKYIFANVKTNEQTQSDIHHMDAFLNGLAPTLKKLPPYYQHLAKGKIFSIVQDLEGEAFFATTEYKPDLSQSGNCSS